MATVYENVSILTSTLPDFNTAPISPFSLKPFHTPKESFWHSFYL